MESAESQNGEHFHLSAIAAAAAAAFFELARLDGYLAADDNIAICPRAGNV